MNPRAIFGISVLLKSLPVRIVVVIVFIAVLAIGGWSLSYPGDDPKGIKYVAWKAGLCKMDPDLAVGIMVGDANRDRLVVGKTKEQLRRRFGDLLTLEEAPEYYRQGHDDSAWKNSDVLFIRNSPWMIVFDGDRATRLILMKGY